MIFRAAERCNQRIFNTSENGVSGSVYKFRMDLIFSGIMNKRSKGRL